MWYASGYFRNNYWTQLLSMHVDNADKHTQQLTKQQSTYMTSPIDFSHHHPLKIIYILIIKKESHILLREANLFK